MYVFEYLQASPAFFVGTVFVLGLLVGSFLNVVILRLPQMMEREWRAQCLEFLGQESAEDAATPALNLVTPGSHCPHCQHKIRAWENIPVLSYLLLRGRCAQCKTRISFRYPAVELLTALASAVTAAHFGFGWLSLFALLLTWGLIALVVIDFDRQLLPDNITLPLLWLGLLVNLQGGFAPLSDSVLGAVAGYLLLWSLYHGFKLLTGKEGMGYGDFKLLAALGAWLGWQALPAIILLSSVVGAVVGISLIALTKRDKNVPIPFGPYLATAGWITLIWGDALVRLYYGWSGIGG